jgi:hypothetical protein
LRPSVGYELPYIDAIGLADFPRRFTPVGLIGAPKLMGVGMAARAQISEVRHDVRPALTERPHVVAVQLLRFGDVAVYTEAAVRPGRDDAERLADHRSSRGILSW